MNIAPCRISRGHCGLPLEGTTSRTYRLCMYVKTSKALPFTLLLSLPLLFSLLFGPPRLLSFRYASTVAPRPRSSTTTTDPPIYLSYVRVFILDTRNAYVFPVRESRVPALYFSALSSLSLSSPCPSYSPRGNQFPFATQPISSPIIVARNHADISSYTRFVNREKQARLARSIPLDRTVLPFRVHLAMGIRSNIYRNSLKRGLSSHRRRPALSNRHSLFYPPSRTIDNRAWYSSYFYPLRPPLSILARSNAIPSLLPRLFPDQLFSKTRFRPQFRIPNRNETICVPLLIFRIPVWRTTSKSLCESPNQISIYTLEILIDA